MSNKGGPFERKICKQLGLWWTNGERDDVFWRSSQSGGRATIRQRQGKKTFGSYGDITALDPIGQPLLTAITFELKRGYPGCRFNNLVETKTAQQTQWESFVEQAEIAHKLAESFSWVLIHRPDYGREVAYIPDHLWEALLDRGALDPLPVPVFTLRVSVRVTDVRNKVPMTIYMLPLVRFLKATKREHFESLAKSRI